MAERRNKVAAVKPAVTVWCRCPLHVTLTASKKERQKWLDNFPGEVNVLKAGYMGSKKTHKVTNRNGLPQFL